MAAGPDLPPELVDSLVELAGAVALCLDLREEGGCWSLAVGEVTEECGDARQAEGGGRPRGRREGFGAVIEAPV